ncbi:MAG: hypothetical protein JNM63_07265 [Spirochaetia bacterium]|nr:hypothetical protein [Spirochaetia bacterium]
MKSILLGLFALSLVANLITCTAYTDPTATTRIQAYPSPLVQSVSLYSNQVSLSIWSHVTSSDFTNTNGYLVYLSSTNSNIQNVSNTLTNTYGGLVTNKPFLLAQIDPDRQPDGTQTAVATITGLAAGTTYYVSVTCFGINSLIAKVYSSPGWVESLPSPIVSFTPRPEFGFSMTNHFAGGGNGAALDFTGTSMSAANANANPSLINNAVFFRVFSNSSGQYVPSLSVGPSSTATLQSLGFSTNTREKTTLPTSGFLGSSAAFPVSAGYVFALKLSSGYYAKIAVTNVSGSPSATNATMTVDGFGAWIASPNSLDL